VVQILKFSETEIRVIQAALEHLAFLASSVIKDPLEGPGPQGLMV